MRLLLLPILLFARTAVAECELPTVTLPDGDFFGEPPARWWRRKSPCPAGSRLRVQVIKEEPGTLYKCVPRGREVLIGRDGNKIAEGVSLNGKKHGLHREWRDGEVSEELYFVADKRHGLYRSFKSQDRIPDTKTGITKEVTSRFVGRTGMFVDDREEGRWTVVMRGRTLTGCYVGGKRQGTWTAALAGREVLSLGYREDAMFGPVTVRSHQGTLVAEGTLEGIDGTWRYYDTQGKLAEVHHCHYGKGSPSGRYRGERHDDGRVVAHIRERESDRRLILEGTDGRALPAATEQKLGPVHWGCPIGEVVMFDLVDSRAASQP